MTRLYQILDLVNRILGEFSPDIRIVEHYTSGKNDIEYLNLRVYFSGINAFFMIREYWHRRTLIAYGYYLQVKGYEEWWDNRPHHPEIPTHPHHRHIGEEVRSLRDYSLESFLKRVKELLC